MKTKALHLRKAAYIHGHVKFTHWSRLCWNCHEKLRIDRASRAIAANERAQARRRRFSLVYVSVEVSLLAFVLSTLHFCKQKGVIFTTTYWYRYVNPTIHRYLEDMFGFSLKKLPVVCGIDCIGHEVHYADTITFQNSNPAAKLQPSFTVVWQKVGSLQVLRKMLDICQSEDIDI